MVEFISGWKNAAVTSLGFFWMALWAFCLGYLISSLIQVLVTRRRMQHAMGETGPKSIVLGTFFGFLSSSCSFSALSATRALFQKGAGIIPSLAFLLASTNLVIELGIVIAIFLGWQFVVGEYAGGFLLIGFVWLFVRLTKPESLVREARNRLRHHHDSDPSANENWLRTVTSIDGWKTISRQYFMEWQMVWKDVLIGFTVAGIIASFVPPSFFETLFVGSGTEQAGDPAFLSVLTQTIIGPVAAFFTFIGSMGNIPLAAVLFDNGVSFAGVMAFIFSDLVVFPVLRINAGYYGWKMALYILGSLLAALIASSLILHYAFLWAGVLPQFSGSGAKILDRDFFALNYGFILNILFLAASAYLGWLWWRTQERPDKHEHHHEEGKSLSDRFLSLVSGLAACWLLVGVLLYLV